MYIAPNNKTSNDHLVVGTIANSKSSIFLHPELSKSCEIEEILADKGDVFLWMATLHCDLLKYCMRWSDLLVTPFVDSLKLGSSKPIQYQTFLHKSMINSQSYADLVFGIRFPVAIAKLKIWVSGISQVVILDFEDSNKLVKKVKFKNPIPLVSSTMYLNITYVVPYYICMNSSDSDDLFIERKLFNPVYEVGSLGSETRKSLYEVIETQRWVESLQKRKNCLIALEIEPIIKDEDGLERQWGIINLDLQKLLVSETEKVVENKEVVEKEKEELKEETEIKDEVRIEIKDF